MKTRNKALLLALCAVLLVCSTIFGTLAYLTDTEAAVNTFTVGQVGISLDEAKVTPDGKVVEGTDSARVQKNEYHLLPGHTYTKDPTVHVDADSEDCWLFVKVDNQIAEIEAKTTAEAPAYTSIADQMTANGWSPVAKDSNIYVYKEIVKKDADVAVFKNFKIDGSVDNKTLANYAPETTGEGANQVTTYKNITVTAYAVQADGFTTAADAWDATFGASTT